MVKIPSFARREERADVDEHRAATEETVVRDRSSDDTERVERADRPTLFGRWADRDRTRVDAAAAGRPAPATPGSHAPSTGPNAPTAEERRLAATDVTEERRRAGADVTEERRLAGAGVTDERRSHDMDTDEERRLRGTDAADARPTSPAGPATDTETRPEVVPAGPKPRTSVLATLSLVLAICGAFLVLSGALAGYGIAVAAIGFLFAVAAFPATRRRHVAGKLDATLGLIIGGAAVVVGILAFTGTFTWPTTDADWVERFRGWLDSQFVDRF
ncbi:thrombospondin [Asanoa sp. WMMD1127]|uniref:thrombospondin n=1 Tax=Asanoa sp. WMMD1127 TaxID=3016107 RepID=UPI002415FC88|nr:thrombospondin [Asanoa sp. WMMD1127]MDG4823101.1 thrombospondin [Asanoa sp. WMMD1127]